MALTLAQETGHVTFSNTGTSTNASFASLPSAGSLIVVMVAGTVDDGGSAEYTVNTVSDNQGNTYARRHSAPNSGDGNVEIWTAENIGTPSGTFTVTVDHAESANNYGVVEAYEVTGAALSGATEQTTEGGGTSPPDGEFVVELIQAKQIIFGGILVLGGGAITPPTNYTETAEASWTETTSEKDFAAEFCHRIVSTSGSHQAQWSHADGDFVLAVATFKATQPTSTVSAAAAASSATTKNALAASKPEAEPTVASAVKHDGSVTSSGRGSVVVSSALRKDALSASLTTASAAVTSTATHSASRSSLVSAAARVTTIGISPRPSMVVASASVVATTRKNAVHASTLTAGAAVTSRIGKKAVSTASVIVSSSGRKGGMAHPVSTAGATVSLSVRRAALAGSAVSAAVEVMSDSRMSRMSAGARVTSSSRPGHAVTSTVSANARVASDAFRPFAPSINVSARVAGGPVIRAQVIGGF